MNDIDTAKLRNIASAARGVDWEPDSWVGGYVPDGVMSHMVTFDPATVIALLDRVEALELLVAAASSPEWHQQMRAAAEELGWEATDD